MSTRGVVGFRYKRKDLLAYNHSDSYPSYLGNKVVRDLHELLREGRQTLLQKVKKLTVVIEETPEPSLIEQKRLAKYGVQSAEYDEYWYHALRKTQGDLRAILDSKYILDSDGFILDSLSCEWGYIVNLDDETLEVYCGYQKKPHKSGRYWKYLRKDGYFPCALVQVFDWTEIQNDVEAVCAEVVALDVENDP